MHKPLAKHIDVKLNLLALLHRTIAVDRLTIEKANVELIKDMIASFQSHRTEPFDSTKKRSNPFVPTNVMVDKITLSILPVAYAPIELNHLVLEAKEVKIDIAKGFVIEAKVELNGSTNLMNAVYKGSITHNQLIGNIQFIPKERLFEIYHLPLRKEAIDKISVDFKASKERIDAELRANAKEILDTKKGAFNVDVESLVSHLVYSLKEGTLRADSEAVLTTPYAKNIFVTNHFVMDGEIEYRGEITLSSFIGIDAKLVKLIKNVHMNYSGDAMGVKTTLRAENLRGYFNVKDFKKGVLHLETLKPIEVNEFIALPKELNQTKVNVVVDAPIEFNTNASVKAKVKMTSNIANIDADILYGKRVQIKAVTHLPQESLLRSWNKEIKWDAFTPTVVEVELLDKSIDIEMKAKEIRVKGAYLLSNKYMEGKIKIGGLYAEISGMADKKISIDTNVTSMHSLMQTVESLYRLDSLPPLEGKAYLSAVITALKKIDITLKSPKLSYRVDRKTTHIIDDTNIVISMDSANIVLKNYRFTYHNQNFFSTKASLLHRQDDIIKVSPLWINDQLKVEGEYNLETKQGRVTADAVNMHIVHELADINSNINLITTRDGNRTSINGKMVLLGGNIHYNMKQKTFASDSDIVIIQEMQKEEASPFMDNLDISVKIDTKNLYTINRMMSISKPK